MIKAQAGKTYLKILAFCTAVVLWLIVITVENHVSVLPDQVTVRVENLEKSLSLGEAMPKVQLFLGVDRSSAATFSPSDFEVVADLTDLGAGEHTVQLTARSKNEKVQILKIEPSDLMMKLSPAAEKEVEARVKVQGEPASEHVVESTLSEVKSVKVRGAQSILDKVTYVEAELILDGTQTEETSQTVSLKVPAEANIDRGLLTIEPEQILVTAAISSKLKQKEVEVIAGFTSEAERTAWENGIAISPQRITVQGSEKDLAPLDQVQTIPVEISSLNRNGFVNVGLQLPEGVTAIVKDQKMNVRLIRKTTEKIIDVPVSLKISGVLTDITISPPAVRVTVNGPQEIMDALNTADIIAVLKRDTPVTGDESAEMAESDISVPVGLSVTGYSPHTFMLLQPDTI